MDTSRRHVVILDDLEQHDAEALREAMTPHYLGIWKGLHPDAQMPERLRPAWQRQRRDEREQ